MMEQLSSQAEDVQWDLALELLPEFAAKERAEREPELERLEAGGRDVLSAQLTLTLTLTLTPTPTLTLTLTLILPLPLPLTWRAAASSRTAP